MVNLNRSFLYGICFASFTWIISLFLYFQITNNENITKTPLDGNEWSQEHISSLNSNNEDILNEKINSQDKSLKLKPIQQRNLGIIDNGRYIQF